MGRLEKVQDITSNTYESLFANLGWSVVKDGSFYVISESPKGNSFENRLVSQIWIDGIQQHLPLRCKIDPKKVMPDSINTIEIDGKKKHFRIIQKYSPHNPQVYDRFISQSFHIGGGQFIKPQVLVERIGYRLIIGEGHGEIFISCEQFNLLTEGKLRLQIGYFELSNIDGAYHFLVNPIKKIQQEKYRMFINGKPIDDIRDVISIPTTSDLFRFDGNGGYFRITDSKSIRFDRGGNIIPNQEFHIDFLDVLSLKVFAGFYPFFRRFTNLTTGTYQLFVDSTRKIIEFKKI